MQEATEADYITDIRKGNQQYFNKLVERYHTELLIYCYRMLGSYQDAEDLVQETFLRAWRHLATFEGRASFRQWLYKIATNVCLDALQKRSRRTLPHFGISSETSLNHPSASLWLEPFPDILLADATLEPEAQYLAHEDIKLAFLVALQILPARQRAVLILRDVLDWSAKEVAELLETTVSAVNSILNRARATLAKQYNVDEAAISVTDETTQKLLDQYVVAWETADVAGLVALLKKDATWSMPPLPVYYQGSAAISAFLAAELLEANLKGYWRLLPTRANNQPAFGVYQYDQQNDIYKGIGLQVLSVEGQAISRIISFLEAEMLTRFRLPATLKA